MSENKIQYQIDIPDEDAMEIFESLAKLLKIDFDSQKLNDALRVEEWDDSKGLCIFRDKSNADRFIMLDAASRGYIAL